MPGPDSPARRAPLVLAAALVYGALGQLVALRANLTENPLGRVPIIDAAAYWEHAGRIGAGQLVGDHPFFSAPLYPYLLGLLRALGGGLAAAFTLNALLWLGAAALVGRIGWRRHSPMVGALAAWLFVLTLDPFFEVGRILAGSLQVFLGALFLERALEFEQRPSRMRGLTLGAAWGLAALAFPPLLLGLLFMGLWAWRFAGAGRALEIVASGALCIAPATLHNYAASGDLVAISAHGGLTFWHGNNPSADGTYVAHEVSNEKAKQHLDALARTRVALGPDASWRDVSAHFLRRGLGWWRDEPVRAAGLAVKKCWLTLSARHYGDIHQPTLERREGFGRALWFAPLSLATWMPVALASVLLLMRWETRRTLPTLLLLGAGLGVCIVFWYTPRYRLPAAPAACLLAAWACVEIVGLGRTRPAPAAALGAALALGLGGGFVNAAFGLDRPADYRPSFELELGRAHVRLDEPDAALVRFQRAADLGHPAATLELSNLRASEPGGLEELARIADARPDDYYAQRSFAVALARAGQPAEARLFFERAIQLDENDWQSHMGLGSALLELADPEAALKPLRTAVSLASEEPDAGYVLALARTRTGGSTLAREELGALLLRHPTHEKARALLVQLLRLAGQDPAAARFLEEGLALQPKHAGMRFVLAWLLATSPDAEARSGARALELARALVAELPGDPERLDILAAALAETGDYESAEQRGAEALDALPSGAPADLRAAMEARLNGYREGRPAREQF